jgi:hypothetical protein
VASYRKLKVTVEYRKSVCPLCKHYLDDVLYFGNRDLNVNLSSFEDLVEDGLFGLSVLSVGDVVVAMNDVLLCPFDGKCCSFPDGLHFKSENFVGCKVLDYDVDPVEGKGDVLWVCPRFPVNMSITVVRDAFDKAIGRR